jgi:predicted HTH transcriptional regulator
VFFFDKKMDLKELRTLISRGENIHLEFKLKTNHPDKIAREIVAFANTEGGKLLIGVADDKEIKGLKYAEEDQFLLEKAITSLISPPIDYKIETLKVDHDKEILIFTINASKSEIHSLFFENEQRIYVRNGDKSLQASKEMRDYLKGKFKNRNYSFQYGDKENILVKYLDQNPYITVSKYAQIAAIKMPIASRTLVLLCLAGLLIISPFENEDRFGLKVKNLN